MLRFKMRRRRVQLFLEDHLRYVPPTESERSLFEEAERILEDDLRETNPDGQPRADVLSRMSLPRWTSGRS